MKTLVFFGSARKNGQTKKMLNYFLSCLDQDENDVTVIDAYRTDNVSPCIDCRYCWKKRGCSIKDGMQDIYPLIDEADSIVMVSPMYFFSLPGPLKSIIDRCQVYWASHVRNDHPGHPIKKGAVLFAGGAPSFDLQFRAGEILVQHLFNDMAVEMTGMVTFPNTDKDSLDENENLQQQIKELAEKLKQPL